MNLCGSSRLLCVALCNYFITQSDTEKTQSYTEITVTCGFEFPQLFRHQTD